MNSALDALLSQTMQKVLELLLLHADRAYYQREIAQLSGSQLRAVQNALSRLVEGGIISRTERGRQVFYQAREDCPIFTELRDIFVKTVGIRDRIRKALQSLDEKIELALIFGSWARGDQQPDSDIDLLIVGPVSLREVSTALRDPAAELGREINPVVMTQQELRKRLEDGDHFATRLAQGETIRIMGQIDDIEEMAG